MAGAVSTRRSLMPRGEFRAIRRVIVASLAIMVAASLPALAEPKYPELSGRVTDEAGLLTPTEKADIESDLASLEQTSTDQLAVVTVKSLQGYAIEDYGIDLARKWGIGQKDKDNGVLLIVAPNDRKIRIEVGRKLEPILTDAMSAIIIQNAMLPKFRRGDFAGGIKDGIRDIKAVLLGDAEEVKQRAAGARQPEDDPTVMVHLAIIFLVVVFIMWVNYRNAQALRAGRGRRPGIFIPGGSGDWGGSGGWSGGGGSGDSGGGWSGGGGDFGGGGASGSW